MVVKASIIVAGNSYGTQPLFGIPAVRRLVLIARQLGIENIHILGKVDHLKAVLGDLVPPESFHPLREREALSGVLKGLSDSLDAGGSEEDDARVLVMKANHVVSRFTLSHLVESARNHKTVCAMWSREATVADAVFIAGKSSLPDVVRTVLPPVGGEDREVPVNVVRIRSLDGLPHAMGGSAEDIRGAEERLVSALPFQTREEDGFLARNFDRSISRLVSSRLARTGVTPNRITLLAMSIGLAGAFLLSLPGYWSHLAGALIFVFCVIMDGVDGEVARLKLMETSFGHYLDITTDNIVHAAIFAGMGFGLYHDTGNPLYINALWVLLGGFALCLVAVYQCILRLSPEELDNSPRLVRIMALMSNRDFAYLVAALAVIGRLEWFLLGAAAGSYVFAATLWWISFREKNTRRKPSVREGE